MRLHTIAILMIGVGIWPGAAQAAVPMLSCADCTPREEEDRAMTVDGSGFLFVHNPEQARVRKFELYFDTKGKQETPDPGRSTGADGVEIASYAIVPDPEDADRFLVKERADATYKGWRRVLVEYPVEPEVRRVAEALAATERVYPRVNYTQDHGERVSVRMEDLGVSQESLAAFDPREIAWSSSQNAVVREFTARLSQMLGTRDGADRLNPVLGQLFYDVWDAAKEAEIHAGTKVENGLTIHRASAVVRLHICDAKERCVYVNADRDVKPVKVEVTAAVDRYDVVLPSGDAGFNVSWGSWKGADAGAREYADWLHKTKNIPVEVVVRADEENRHHLVCATTQGRLPLRCKMYTP